MAGAAKGSDPRIHVDLEHLAALEYRARDFDFMPRQPVGSVLTGRRASRLRGRGLEFEEIRAYLPGDDIRSIDWKVTARTGSPHVRVTREERDRPAFLLVDQRQSMFFGSRLNMKSVTAAEIAALAAWRIFASGDRVGGMTLTDGGYSEARAVRSRAGVLRFLGDVAAANGALSADAPIVEGAAGRLNEAIRRASGVLTHDWLFLMVSDFDGADDVTRRLLTDISQRNDVVTALVHDPIANEIPESGRIVVGDGRLQVELDMTETQARRNLTSVGGDRLKRLVEWQQVLDAAILPISAGEATGPQLLRLFGGDSERRSA